MCFCCDNDGWNDDISEPEPVSLIKVKPLTPFVWSAELRVGKFEDGPPVVSRLTVAIEPYETASSTPQLVTVQESDGRLVQYTVTVARLVLP